MNVYIDNFTHEIRSHMSLALDSVKILMEVTERLLESVKFSNFRYFWIRNNDECLIFFNAQCYMLDGALIIKNLMLLHLIR